jgi:phosphoribosyl 1,2-cyclic phosphodiesterase
MEIQFWGVRGSIPTPQGDKLGYGGNTPCIEVKLPGEDVLLLDAGTGIRGIGFKLINEKSSRNPEVHLFLSHFHWDHIQGFPFFFPILSDKFTINIYSGVPEERLKEILKAQMQRPAFPLDFHALPSTIRLIQIYRDPVYIHDTRVIPFKLNHPHGATGYRIESEGSVLVYASDHEHGDPEADLSVREHAKGADALVFDTHFTPEEYPSVSGWGHSTWKEAIKVCRESAVKRLFLFHHNPDYSDQKIDEICAQARLEFPSVQAAKEGLIVRI